MQYRALLQFYDPVSLKVPWDFEHPDFIKVYEAWYVFKADSDAAALKEAERYRAWENETWPDRVVLASLTREDGQDVEIPYPSR